MSLEQDAVEVPAAVAVPPPDQDGRDVPRSPGTPPVPDVPVIEIAIERDLAVQLVGSDAGRARRMRPHGAMTRGASAEECADVRAVMEPFLNDEIRRVHADRTHRPGRHVARVTPRQAESLKQHCRRFADFLGHHLEQHPGDDNRHRSQQRLDQARRVIAQVNATLGIPHDDGRPLEQVHKELVAKLAGLAAEIAALRDRAEALGKLETVRPLVEIQDVLRCLTEPAAAS